MQPAYISHRRGASDHRHFTLVEIAEGFVHGSTLEPLLTAAGRKRPALYSHLRQSREWEPIRPVQTCEIAHDKNFRMTRHGQARCHAHPALAIQLCTRPPSQYLAQFGASDPRC